MLSNQRGLRQYEKGRRPKDPTARREGTREPRRRGAICCCGLSRQPQARSGQTVGEVRPTSLPSSSTVVTVLWRCLQFLDKFDTPVTPARCRVFFDKVVDVPVVLCNGVPQVQSVSLSVASERHVTSITVVSAQTTVKVKQLLGVPVAIPQAQFLDKFDTPVLHARSRSSCLRLTSSFPQ